MLQEPEDGGTCIINQSTQNRTLGWGSRGAQCMWLKSTKTMSSVNFVHLAPCKYRDNFRVSEKFRIKSFKYVHSQRMMNFLIQRFILFYQLISLPNQFFPINPPFILWPQIYLQNVHLITPTPSWNYTYLYVIDKRLYQHFDLTVTIATSYPKI